ncbi:MAG: M20/M25/M40 family metallo-hydrolase [Nitrospinota bacterium]|nr:M20/M25/M40 family metallo-hydrolase [Nitrospinota bacterium]
MNRNEWDEHARNTLQMGSDRVQWHMSFMKEMVGIDSRSFNVNEFEGDRTTPTDMKEILELAQRYLHSIGFPTIHINVPPPGPERSTPILMAEIVAGNNKPTLLMYAHLDKQPYMDDERFEKWEGYPPTELRWNAEGTRAYGRGAADDLSGVVAIGMAVDTLLRGIGFDAKNPEPGLFEQLPCNIKIIFETEEESGSHTLIPQILQNRKFFESSDCVIITDVTNPDTGIPGLTTSLRGVIQMNALMKTTQAHPAIDEQTALYKVLATLIHEDHSLAVTDIAKEDIPVTEKERQGYEKIPTTLEALRAQAGLLSETQLTVPSNKVDVIEAELRTSYANVRPWHRVAGGVVFGSAGTRFHFHTEGLKNRKGFTQWMEETFRTYNRFGLKIRLRELEASETLTLELILQSADKDPHSGMFGGPFPVPELQLAHLVDRLIEWDGRLAVTGWQEFFEPGGGIRKISLNALHVEHDGSARPFKDPSARALVEIRLAPGHRETTANEHLKQHLLRNVPAGFSLELKEDKGGPPWMTGIDHPAFTFMLESLKAGYGHEACLYGCGGSIPFVAKLMDSLGSIPPLCLGAYDPDCRMHETGESLSMVDLLGCARSIVHFMLSSPQAFPQR